ncbi:MAG: efflux RND transporter periplasmic adaptor subunit [Actinoplanes sp.]
MGRTGAVLGVLATVTLIGGGTALVTVRGRPSPVAAIIDPTLATTRVERTDLADSRLLPGTLGFGTARPVKGVGPGVVTALPKVGAKVSRGKQLYRVDDQPVLVFYGRTPLFRPLDKAGLTGRDVRQLRDNLAALGYSVRGEDVLDARLLAALKSWQTRRGVAAPGKLLPGQVAVLTGPGRVSALTAQPGDPAAGPLLSVTATGKVVTVPMSPAEAGGVREGAKVSITLPDARVVRGRVTGIGSVVEGGGEDPTGGTEPAKMTVTVTPDKPISTVDSAEVQVRFTMAARKKVLVVPVGALVALREGGYALQRPDGTLVAAVPGLFAGGLVQISGAGVTEGLTVVTTP